VDVKTCEVDLACRSCVGVPEEHRHDCPGCSGTGKERGVRVLQVDQWTSSGKLTGRAVADVLHSGVVGGDAVAARRLGVASMILTEVALDAEPRRGDVWYCVSADGTIGGIWKANYDSSD